MKQGKTIIIWMTILLMALMLFAATQEEPPKIEGPSLTFAVPSGADREIIRCVQNEAGDYVAFLPGYADMDQVFPILKGTQVTVGGSLLAEDKSCGEFSLNTEYPLTYISGGRQQESTLTFVRSGGIASMYIDVSSGSMVYIHMDKTHEETGVLRLYDAEGKPLYAGKLDSIKGRGNSTWFADKKPYNLTLAQEADLLGMGAAQKWILLAEAKNDLNIRNKIVCDFASKVGLPYSPDCEWVDLYLNGEYAGLYLLSEKNEVHPERVDISKDGSFLISMESKTRLQEQKIPYVSLGTNQVLRTRYVSMTDEQLRQIWMTLARALSAADGVDPVSGKHWQELIDLDSWVKKYLIEEVFANPDGERVSQYFYMDGGDPSGRIYAGPVWDYDFSMGGEDYWMRDFPSYMIMEKEYQTMGETAQDGNINGTSFIIPMFYELNNKPEFQKRLAELYEEVYLSELEKITQTELDAYFAQIEKAALANAVRWDIPVDCVYRDVAFIRGFLERRMDFLSDLWITGTQYHMVDIRTGPYNNGYFMVKDGETLPDLTGYLPSDGVGWTNAETGELFDITQPIYEDASVRPLRDQKEDRNIISLMPAVFLTAALLLWMLLDRYHTKQNGGGKREPVHTV